MDKDIKDLIDYISKSNFVEFELEREGFKIKLVKAGGKIVVQNAPSKDVISNNTGSEVAAQLLQQGGVPIHAPEGGKEGLFDVKSPIVGTLYRSPNPDAPPFVEVGSLVKKGQVLCIVEAMKLMNEIESETAGEIVEILVPNAHPVEYGQVIFRIKPAE